MDVLAMILCAVLALIGLVHLLWALGIVWPYKDEQSLARAVVGARDIKKMPSKWASLFVAVWLFAAGLWALALRGLGPADLSQVVTFLGGAGLAAVFGLRGIFGILPAFEKMTPEEPFLTLNRKFYSPLCIAIGISFALLALSMPNWGWRIFG